MSNKIKNNTEKCDNKIEKIERNITFIDSPILETIAGFSSLKDVGVMQVFETLIEKPSNLTGSEIKFIRSFVS